MNIGILDDNEMDIEYIIQELSRLGINSTYSFLDLESLNLFDKLAEIEILIADYFLGNGQTINSLLGKNTLSKKNQNYRLYQLFRGKGL